MQSQQEAAKEAGPLDVLFAFGLAGDPCPQKSPTSDGKSPSWYINPNLLSNDDAPEDHWHFDSTQGPVYTDGSADLNDSPQHAHAGWACVQIDDEGAILKAARGAVPCAFEQSSSIAEHIAWYMAAFNAKDIITVVSDNQGVVDDASNSLASATKYNKPFGGL